MQIDRYKVNEIQVKKYGGHGLMAVYNDSLFDALCTIFPGFCYLFITKLEYHWKIWKFDNVHQGHWTNPENQRKFFKELGGTNIMKVIKKR